jgi:Family of unknown function (DUF6152)
MKRFLVAAVLALPLAVAAHHGWSEYDTSKVLKLTGKIIESGYEHPHGHIRFETKAGEGAKAGKTWTVTLAPPSRMENRGLPKEWLKPGATATVEGYPNRKHPEEMRAERITINGKTIELR